ncbi:MAG: hypothetical protein Q9162_003232 [Coniocarpon cinnabarinum]
MTSHASIPAESQSITHQSGRSGPPDLRFIHYNDVYHVDASSAEPVGGIARFQSVCDYYRDDASFKDEPKLMTLFSGDAFNPSLESSVTKGPDVPMGNAKKTVILTASNGIKVGLIGLVEREWLDTINSLPPNIVYKSATATAKELAPQLRADGADIVIAITHAREPNDLKLAKQTPPGMLDMILGGHDHFYGHSVVNGTHCLRSGTDFKQLSYIKAWRKADRSGWDFDITRRDIVRSIPEDPKAAALVEKIESGLRSRLEKPIGYTSVPLDARFTTVRLKESNIGNFVADLMRLYYGADCALMASGTIRGDQVYPAGVIRAKDILNCFPFEDPCLVIKLSGKAILEAVENSVSTYPVLEGRFPQVSNITFSFDPKALPHKRVHKLSIAGKPYDANKLYTMTTRDYMARGKDGFTSLMPTSEGGTAEELISDENGILLSMLLRQYFLSLKILGRWGRGLHSVHKHFEDRIHDKLHACHPVQEPRRPSAITMIVSPKSGKPVPAAASQAAKGGPLDFANPFGAQNASPTSHNPDDSEDEGDNTLHQTPSVGDRRDREFMIMRKVLRKWFRLAGLQGHPGISGPHAEVSEEFQVEMGWTKAISPRVEGRITVLGSGPEA